MNKATSVVIITVTCLLSVLIFGYYLESDSTKTIYGVSLISNRAVLVQAVNEETTKNTNNTEYLSRPDTKGVVRGDLSDELKFKYAVQLEEKEVVSKVVSLVANLGEKHVGETVVREDDLDREDLLEELADPIGSSRVTERRGKDSIDDHAKNATTSGSKNQSKVKVGHKYKPGLSHKQSVFQRQLSDLYLKGKGLPSKTLALQKANLQRQVVRYNRLQNQGPRNWRKLPISLYQQAPVIFDSVPKEFLPQYKNPCWYSANKQIMCLPYYYLLGFPKAGTTDLWDKINNHPQVSRTVRKETQFWRDHKIGSSVAFQKYLANSMLLNRRLLAGDTQAVSGDGSATTVISHNRFVPFFPNVTAGMYTNIDIIKEITPKAKMIIAIREPVERLYSGYLYHPIKEKRSVQGFHQEAVYYVKNFNNCLKRHTEIQCIFEKVPTEGRTQRLKTGMYEPYIRSWVDGFGFDQVMIIRLEDWKVDCVGILQNIFEFLELAPQTESTRQRLCIRHIKNQHKRDIGPMLEKTKQMLEDFYAPFNERLSNLLNRSSLPRSI